MCSIFLVAMVLYLWFNTDAFVEYAALFKLVDLTDYNERYIGQHYTVYLLDQSKNWNSAVSFLVRLINCPKCLCFWLAFLVSITTGIVWLPVIYCMGLTTYSILAKLDL